MPSSQEPSREPDGAILAPALTPIRELNRQFELDLEEPEDMSTLGGLCLHLAGGRIPHAGESFRAQDGTRIEVIEASPRRIRTVRLRPDRGPRAN